MVSLIKKNRMVTYRAIVTREVWTGIVIRNSGDMTLVDWTSGELTGTATWTGTGSLASLTG